MSMSSSHLRAALSRSKSDWGSNSESGSTCGGNLEDLIREGQNRRFKRPHLRDYGYRLPIPFGWGPNGSLLLLLALMVPAALLGAVILIGGMVR